MSPEYDDSPQLPPPPAGYTVTHDATGASQLPPPPAGYDVQYNTDLPGVLQPSRVEEGMPIYSVDVYGRVLPPSPPMVYQGRDAEGKPIIATPPPPPPMPALPWGLRKQPEPTLRNIDPRTGEFIKEPAMGTVPILDWPYSGGLQMGEGVRQAGGGGYIDASGEYKPPETLSFNRVLGGGSKILRGGMEAGTVLLPYSFATAPLETALTLISGSTIGAVSEPVLRKVFPPGTAAFLSDVASIAGAGWTYKKLRGIAGLANTQESNAINQQLESLMEEAKGEQAKDPNAETPRLRALRAQMRALMGRLEEIGSQEPDRPVTPRDLAAALPRRPGDLYPNFMKVPNRLNPEEQASQDYLTKQLGVNTPLSMQTGSPVAAGYEGAVRNAMGGGYAVEQRALTREQIIQAGRERLGKIAPEATSAEYAGGAVRGKLAGDLAKQKAGLASEVSLQASTPELAGSKVIETGKGLIRSYDQAANEAYQAAWAAEQDPRNTYTVPTFDKNGKPVLDDQGKPVTEQMALPIDVSEVQRALKPIADQYERTLSDTDAHASIGLKAMRNLIRDAPIRPLRAVELDLGMLKEAARNENLPELRDTSQGLAAASIKALQAKIDQTMARAAYPGWDPASGTPSPALRHLQAGRANTAKKYDVADTFAQFGRRNIEDLEPVGVYQGLTWAGDAGINRLRDVAKIAPDAMPSVGRAFIDSGGNWDKLGPETKKILFRDPKVIAGLDDYYAQQARFGKLTEMEPVRLFERLTQPEGRANELLADVAKKAPEQMPQLGRAFVEGLLNTITREGDINKVQSNLDAYLNMDPKSKNLLLGDPKQVREWQNFFFSLKRLNREVNTSGTGYINALNKFKGDILRGIGMMGGAVLGGTYGGGGAEGTGLGVGAGLAAGAGAEWGLNKILARMLYDPRFTRLLNRGLQEELRGNDEGVRLTSRDLVQKLKDSGLLGEEPPQGPPAGGGTPPGGAGPEAEPAPETPGLGEKIKGAIKKFWEEEEGSLKLGNLRKADLAAGSEQSTRVPTAVKATEDPLSNILTTGYESWSRDPVMLGKNVNAMLEYPNFSDLRDQVRSGALSIPDAAEQMIGRIQENLQWLHDAMPEEFRDRARLWYDGAHTIARKWAGDYGATPEQVAATMAVTSPGTDWFVNAERARRLLEFWQDRGSKVWDPRMEKTWRDKVIKAVPEDQQKQVYRKIRGQSFNDVQANNPHLAPIWFRLYDEAVNPREYPTLTPEGKAGDLARIGSGDPRQFSWSDFGQIAKGLSILEDGSRENIHEKLGQEHKVRNFYNNIINPDSPREHTTIDTHAVGAGLMRPLSQMSTEVGHNFGGTGSSSSSITGESGTYGLYKEAYRRAAAANDLLPREMQSITWEAIRSMFSPAFKRSPANVEYINSLWRDVSSGKITADAARQRALQYGGGFDRPAWFKGRWNPGIPKKGRNPSQSH